MAKTFIWTIGSFRLKAVKQLRIIQNYKIHFCLYIYLHFFPVFKFYLNYDKHSKKNGEILTIHSILLEVQIIKRVIFSPTKYIQGPNKLVYLVTIYLSTTSKMLNFIIIYF